MQWGWAVSLRGKDETGPAAGARPMVSFRCPEELRDYIKEAARSSGRDQTQVLVQALEVDRELEQGLREEARRLNLYAATNDLSLRTELGKVLVALVKQGLDAWEAGGGARPVLRVAEPPTESPPTGPKKPKK